MAELTNQQTEPELKGQTGALEPPPEPIRTPPHFVTGMTVGTQAQEPEIENSPELRRQCRVPGVELSPLKDISVIVAQFKHDMHDYDEGDEMQVGVNDLANLVNGYDAALCIIAQLWEQVAELKIGNTLCATLTDRCRNLEALIVELRSKVIIRGEAHDASEFCA